MRTNNNIQQFPELSGTVAQKRFFLWRGGEEGGTMIETLKSINLRPG